MNVSSSQQANTYLFGSMKNLSLVKKQETECGDIGIRRENSVIDAMNCNLLPEGNRRQIQQLPKSHSIKSIVSEETTQEDIDELVSQYFAASCEKYYRRCSLLDKLIEAEDPADDSFMEIMNSGPMYATDACRYVKRYVNKFNKYLLVQNTVLSQTQKLMAGICLPMDIYEQVPFMDLLPDYSYIVVKNGKAADALSAMKDKFSIIDCAMAGEIAYYETIMSLIGEKDFNMIFERDANRPFILSCDMRSLFELCSMTGEQENDNLTQIHPSLLTIKKGTVYFFMNHKEYINKHPYGVANGFNVMLVNKVDKCLYFTGFGFPGCGLSVHDIIQELIDLFNRPAFDDFKDIEIGVKMKASGGEKYKILKNKTITTDELYANKGGWDKEGGVYLDVNKIKKKLGYLVLMRAVEIGITGKLVDLLHGAK